MNETMTDYRCPTHNQRLRFVLRGDAGWCSECRVYLQAAGVPMPELDPRRQKKRKAAQKTKRTSRAKWKGTAQR